MKALICVHSYEVEPISSHGLQTRNVHGVEDGEQRSGEYPEAQGTAWTKALKLYLFPTVQEELTKAASVRLRRYIIVYHI